MKLVKKIIIILIVLITCVMLIIGLTYYDVSRNTAKLIFSQGDDIPDRYVAIVLGARVYADHTVSPVLADRLLTGIELYRQGKVKKLLLSGDNGQKGYDEVNAMRKFVTSHGVPEQDVFLDHAGFSTYQSMYRARDIFVVDDAIIVTQDFHLPRAVYIARKLGLDAVGVRADKRQYVGMMYLERREALARVKAVFEVLTRAKPKYLGEVLPITGDGRVTYDQIETGSSRLPGTGVR